MKRWVKLGLLCASIISTTMMVQADTKDLTLVASYDMSYEDDRLLDVSSMENDAQIVGFSKDDFLTEGTDEVLRFQGNSGEYIKLPAGLIEKEVFAIEATFETDRAENSWLWTLGTNIQDVGNNYVFLSPKFSDGQLRSGIKNSSQEVLFSNPGQINTGTYYTMRVEFNHGAMELYVDDEWKSSLTTDFSIQDILKNGSNEEFCGYIGKSLYAPDPAFSGTLTQFDVYAEAKTEKEMAEEDASGIQLPGEVWENLELPTKGNPYGSTIQWESSHPEIVSDKGVYVKPEKTTKVTLTASVTNGNETCKKAFELTAICDEDLLSSSHLMIPYTLKPGDVLPDEMGGKKITWSCAQEEYVTADGDVKGPKMGISDPLKLTASILVDEKTMTKDYEVCFLGEDYQQILGYTRDNSANGGYRVGNSLHLAYSVDGKSFEALNSNYGILFAQADYTGSIGGSTRTLKEPYIFRMKEGGFGVLAIRAYENNEADRPGELLFFTSGDLIQYEDHGLKVIHKNKNMTNVTCEYDASNENYRIGWLADGQQYICTTEDFETFTEPVLGTAFEAAAAKGFNLVGTISENLIFVTKEEGVAIRNKLGRITNTTVEDASYQVEIGETIDLSDVRVTLNYSDGSTADKRVEWNQEEIDGIDTSVPGIYEVSGTVISEAYPFPMMANRADPTIIYYEGKYYFIATDAKYEKQFNLYIRCADTIMGLKDTALAAGSATKDVNDHLLWDGESTTIQDKNGNWISNPHEGIHWAPELHVIEDRLYCFFAMRPSNSAGYYEPQCYIARLEEGGDPLEINDWEEPVRVMDPDGNPLLEQSEGISLDMTYFEADGISYVCWSQRLFANGEAPGLLIAETDPYEPWQLLSEPVRIADNTYSWERDGCNEGPYVLKKDDLIYMVFSANGVGPQYATGMMIAAEGDDLTDPDVWTKSNYPWMHNGVFDGQYGLGHNAFFQDEYGDWYNVYHAMAYNYYSDRISTVVPIHFRADGSPVLDMKPNEVVKPSNRNVKVMIQVGDTTELKLPYEDVSKGDWFYEAVEYTYVEELMTGMDEKHFGPYGRLSRAQFALILYRMEGLPSVKTDKTFGDVTGSEWYGQAVLWAAEAGIVTGYTNGNFGPTDDITREQMAVMMHRYAKFLKLDVTNDGDLSMFEDGVSVSPFATEAFKWANANGIITGKENGTKLDPQGNTARCEAAAIIQRFMK